MTHPDFTILYIDNPPASTEFYKALLGAEPVEACRHSLCSSCKTA